MDSDLDEPIKAAASHLQDLIDEARVLVRKHSTAIMHDKAPAELKVVPQRHGVGGATA